MKRGGLLVALLLIVAAAAWWWRATPTVQTSTAASPETERPGGDRVAIEQPRQTALAKIETKHEPLVETNAPTKARLELPRPAARADAPAPFQLAKEKGLRDKRAGNQPGAARELETLRYGLDTLHEDVEECLKEWSSKSSTITGSVRIAFQVDAKGLTRAWLEGADRVPFGPRTCLGNAAYGIDWSNIVDHPAEVTDDFELNPTQED